MSTYRQLRDLIQDFGRDVGGNVIIIFALSLTIIFGLIGSAYDLNISAKAKKELQAVLDAAVLEGIKHDGTQATPALPAGKLERDIAEALLLTRGQTVSDFFTLDTYNFSFIQDANQVRFLEGEATAKFTTIFLNVLGVNEMTITVNSTSTVSGGREQACFMAMHPTNSHTLELHGVITVQAPGCHIYGNSTHHNDVIDPHDTTTIVQVAAIGSGTDGSVQTVGGGHHYLENVDILQLNSEVVANPFTPLTSNFPNWPNRPRSVPIDNHATVTRTSPPPRFLRSPDPWNTPPRSSYSSLALSNGNALDSSEGNLTVDRLYMGRNDRLIIQGSRSIVITKLLTVGRLEIASGATLDMRNSELHAELIVLAPGATLITSNSIVFQHNPTGGKDLGCASEGSFCNLELQATSTFRLSGLTTSNLPFSSSGGQDWRGYAMFAEHTPDDYSYAGDYQFLASSVVDVHGCVISPQTFIYWEQGGDHSSMMNHRWTCWIIAGVNWRGSGGPNILRYNFNPSASGAIPYPTLASNLVPGSASNVKLVW